MTLQQLEALRVWIESLIDAKCDDAQSADHGLSTRVREQLLWEDVVKSFLAPPAEPEKMIMGNKNVCGQCGRNIAIETCGGEGKSSGKCLAERRGIL